MSLSSLNDRLAQVRTKNNEFWARIEQIIPWGGRGSYHPAIHHKGDRGNKPYGLELMLHPHIRQNLYDLQMGRSLPRQSIARHFLTFVV